MADRYLIGTGARNWDDPNIWSLTSGGSPYQPASGVERIINGGFAADTNWNKGAGWTISGGVLNVNVSAWSGVTQNIPSGVANKWFKVTYTIVSKVSGSDLRFYMGEGNTLSVSTEIGTYTIYLLGGLSGNLFSIGSLSFVGSIDNISVQEVDNIAPNSVTNAIIDQNSGTGTITIGSNTDCLNLDMGAANQSFTLSNSAYAFNIYGNLIDSPNRLAGFTGTGYLYFKATTTGKTITSNGNIVGWNRVYFDGVGGEWTNQDDWNVNANSVYLVNGHWNVNGKQFTTTGNFATNTGTRTLNITSSIFNVNFFQIPDHQSPNLTVNANLSTINLLGTTFQGCGKTYYNINWISIGTMTLSGANTINNITHGSYGPFPLYLILDANQTINGTLNINGTNAVVARLIVKSSTIGTPRTITCNGTISASNVDFRDITLAGTANRDLSGITGGSGDCGGNSGIVFTTAQPQYFKKYASTANYGDAANWFSDLALTVAGRVPLPQDLGSKFLATSFDRTCTVTCNVPRIPCLDMSEVVNSVTWSLANEIEVYGSYVLGNNITQSGNQYLSMHGRGSFIIKTYNKPIYSLNLIGFGGTFTFQSDFTIPTTGFYISHGNNITVDFNDFNITSPQIISSGGTATGYFGNGLITLTGVDTGTLLFTPANFFCENSHIIFNSASGSANLIFAGASKIYNKIQFSGSHTGNFDISGNNTIAELIIDSGRKVRFTAGTTQTIAKATIGSNVTLDCITASTYTLALNDITTAENANIKGCIAPVSKLFAEANSVDSGSNTNVVFGDYFTPQEIMIENRIN